MDSALVCRSYCCFQLYLSKRARENEAKSTCDKVNYQAYTLSTMKSSPMVMKMPTVSNGVEKVFPKLVSFRKVLRQPRKSRHIRQGMICCSNFFLHETRRMIFDSLTITNYKLCIYSYACKPGLRMC